MSGGIRSLQEGDELVRRILDAVPGGVVHVASDGSIRQANPEALRILGIRFDELSKRYIADYGPETIFEDGRPCTVEDYPVAKVLATGKPQAPVTIGVRRPDGQTYWAIFRAEPVLEENGDLAGAIVTFIDITERKLAEEELRRSEQKWRSLGENLPDFVITTDRFGRILSVNHVYEHLDEAAVLRSTLFDYLDPSVIEEYRRAFDDVCATGKPTRIETRGEGPGGKIVWYETMLAPLAEGTEVTRLLVVSRDVTERRAILASLAEKERLASVGMVAASVAHEIMNPLTYVLANLDFVVGERSQDEARRTRAIVEAREGAKRMQQIVWDLRALGRAGNEELFYVDARSVFETALRLSGPEVTRSAEVVLELGPVTGVLASESRLCQVFINLLVNAAQAMDPKPKNERRIRVRTREDETLSLVGIEISDTGVGIERNKLERIFEPFYTTKATGTGLGLSICRDIIERMGGKIEVTSTVGVETTFTVWLSTKRELLPAPPRGESAT